MFEYQAQVLRVVDGDTLDVSVDLGLDVHTRQRLRLYGLNTPERGQPGYQAAIVYVQQWLANHAPSMWVRLNTIKDGREKYGRYLAVVGEIAMPTNILNDRLISEQLAKAYYP